MIGTGIHFIVVQYSIYNIVPYNIIIAGKKSSSFINGKCVAIYWQYNIMDGKQRKLPTWKKKFALVSRYVHTNTLPRSAKQRTTMQKNHCCPRFESLGKFRQGFGFCCVSFWVSGFVYVGHFCVRLGKICSHPTLPIVCTFVQSPNLI